MQNCNSPVFIGGTGRSGTSIMGKYLNSHCDLTRPVSENKLIVEHGGLRSLIDNLSSGFEYKGNHYAIANFIKWSNTLRTYGFKNSVARSIHRGSNRALSLVTSRKIPVEKLCRAFPSLDFSVIGIGDTYGVSHYDKCIAQFLEDVTNEVDESGIVDTEGVIKPVYSSKTSSRQELMGHARNLLYALNKEIMREAGVMRWCDDTPLNAYYSDFLLELYPACKVVHMVRDPRDVAASYSEKMWASRDLEKTLSRLNRHYLELIEVERNLPEENFRTFRLEDFTEDTERRREDLSRFLEINSDGFDGSVSFEASSFGRWKKKFSAKESEIVERELSEACAHFGYL